tara:strand:- start:358 stop:483 length:126 start_codon:yes stop_codon:yes gene_type:complete
MVKRELHTQVGDDDDDDDAAARVFFVNGTMHVRAKYPRHTL